MLPLELQDTKIDLTPEERRRARPKLAPVIAPGHQPIFSTARSSLLCGWCGAEFSLAFPDLREIMLARAERHFSCVSSALPLPESFR